MIANIEPNYFDNFNSPTSVVLSALNINQCDALCVQYSKCIFYAVATRSDEVYNFNIGDCILKTKLDVANGIYNNDFAIYSMISTFISSKKKEKNSNSTN